MDIVKKYSKNNKDGVTKAQRVLLKSMIPREVRVGQEGLHRNLKAMVLQSLNDFKQMSGMI